MAKLAELDVDSHGRKHDVGILFDFGWEIFSGSLKKLMNDADKYDISDVAEDIAVSMTKEIMDSSSDIVKNSLDTLGITYSDLKINHADDFIEFKIEKEIEEEDLSIILKPIENILSDNIIQSKDELNSKYEHKLKAEVERAKAKQEKKKPVPKEKKGPSVIVVSVPDNMDDYWVEDESDEDGEGNFRIEDVEGFIESIRRIVKPDRTGADIGHVYMVLDNGSVNEIKQAIKDKWGKRLPDVLQLVEVMKTTDDPVGK